MIVDEKNDGFSLTTAQNTWLQVKLDEGCIIIIITNNSDDDGMAGCLKRAFAGSIVHFYYVVYYCRSLSASHMYA